MVLEPQIKEIEIKSNKKLEDVNISVPVTLNTNGEKIEKVLLIKSFVKVEKTTVSQGMIQIAGALNSFALIKLENGEIVEIKKMTNFSQNYASTQIDANSKVLVRAKVFGTENLFVNEISLSFVQQIGVTIFVCEQQMIKYVEELNKANQKMGTINYQTIQNFSLETFELLSEIDLPSSISKILVCDCEINVKDFCGAKDIVTLDGEICTNLIYLTNDDVPKIKQQNYVSEFHQEMLIGGICEKDVLNLEPNITNCDYSVVGEMNSKGILELKTGVQAYVVARRNVEINCMLDAFCPYKELQLQHQSFRSENLVFRKNYNYKIDGSYELSGDAQIAQIICSYAGHTKVIDARKEQDNVIIKGEASLFVVLKLDDEQNTLESVNITIPFENVCACDEQVDVDNIFVDVKIKEIQTRSKRTKEVDALVDLRFDVCATKTFDEVVVSDVCLGDERKQELHAMGIYVVSQAKDCWEIAKKLLVNPDVLMKQNKELTFPITKPTQIIVYRQKSID